MFQPSIRVDKPNEGNPKKNPMDKAIISRIWTFCLGCFFLSFLFGFFVGRFAVEGLLRGPAGAARVQHRKGHQSRSGSYPSDAILIGIEEIRRDVHFSKGNHTVLGPIILLPSRLIRALWKRTKKKQKKQGKKRKKKSISSVVLLFLALRLVSAFLFLSFFLSLHLSLSLSLSLFFSLSLSFWSPDGPLSGWTASINLFVMSPGDRLGRSLIGWRRIKDNPPPAPPPTHQSPPTTLNPYRVWLVVAWLWMGVEVYCVFMGWNRFYWTWPCFCFGSWTVAIGFNQSLHMLLAITGYVFIGLIPSLIGGWLGLDRGLLSVHGFDRVWLGFSYVSPGWIRFYWPQVFISLCTCCWLWSGLPALNCS